MQISTPAQVPGSPDGALPREPGPATANFKNLKNDKLGVFSKILEGLLKTKPGDQEGLLLKKGTGKTAQAAAQEGILLKGTQGKKKNVAASEEGKVEKVSKETLSGKPQRSRRSKTLPEDGLSGAVLDGSEKNIPEKTQTADSRLVLKEKNGEKTGKLETPGEKNPHEAFSAESSAMPETQELARLLAEPETQDPNIRKAEEKKAETNGVQPKSVLREREIETPIEKVSFNPRQSSEQSEKEGAKSADAKGKEKRRVNVEVRDLRTGETVRQDQAQGLQLTQEAKTSADSKTVDLTLDLSLGNRSREAAFREADARPAQGFEDMLARELHQNLNGDIVRQAQIILREHGEGTIRLSLKPESLGNVKIQLEMAENKITGHIIVESNDALRAFEREIRSLEQAFKDSGFAEAHLDMSLASGSEGNGANPQQRENNPFFSEQTVAAVYDAAADRAEEQKLGDKGSGLSLVNMLA